MFFLAKVKIYGLVLVGAAFAALAFLGMFRRSILQGAKLRRTQERIKGIKDAEDVRRKSKGKSDSTLVDGVLRKR